jgi:hypothetical protein
VYVCVCVREKRKIRSSHAVSSLRHAVRATRSTHHRPVLVRPGRGNDALRLDHVCLGGHTALLALLLEGHETASGDHESSTNVLEGRSIQIHCRDRSRGTRRRHSGAGNNAASLKGQPSRSRKRQHCVGPFDPISQSSELQRGEPKSNQVCRRAATARCNGRSPSLRERTTSNKQRTTLRTTSNEQRAPALHLVGSACGRGGIGAGALVPRFPRRAAPDWCGARDGR